MILKALTLENFKGIREPVRIEFAPLTLLFGPNSSGKSTIIKALQLASAIFGGQHTDPFDSANANGFELGNFRDSVNGHDLNKSINLTFDLALVSSLTADYDREGWFDRAEEQDCLFMKVPTEGIAQSITTAKIAVAIHYDRGTASAYVANYDVSLNDVRFGSIEYSPADKTAIVSFLNFCHPLLFEIDPKYMSLASKDGTAFDAWLTDWGCSPDTDVREHEGDDSNTVLESIVTQHNEAPYEHKAFPIRIKKQRSAVSNLWKALPLAIGNGLSKWSSNSDPEIVKCQIARIILSEGLLAPAAALQDIASTCIFLGPLRDIPSRHPIFQRPTTGWSSGQSAWDIIVNADDEFLSRVNDWLSKSDRLASGYGVDVVRYREILDDELITSAFLAALKTESSHREEALAQFPIKRRIVLLQKPSNVELSLHDVGVGLSQLLPVVVATLHHESPFLSGEHWVFVEQPELHLHPALQVRLADLFIAQAKDWRKVFLLETHSEHLMLRCLRRIRETSEGKVPEGAPTLRPEDIAVHFVEPEEGGPRIHRIRIDEDGEFRDPWPRGFFQERSKELYGDDL